MRFFVDEDLSPALVEGCHRAGYDATCSRDRAMLGVKDHEVAAFCMAEERILVTNNVGDFLDLAMQAGVHPGLVVMPLGSRDEELAWINAAIAEIEQRAETAGETPAESMINGVIEVDEDGACEHFDHP